MTEEYTVVPAEATRGTNAPNSGQACQGQAAPHPQKNHRTQKAEYSHDRVLNTFLESDWSPAQHRKPPGVQLESKSDSCKSLKTQERCPKVIDIRTLTRYRSGFEFCRAHHPTNRLCRVGRRVLVQARVSYPAKRAANQARATHYLPGRRAKSYWPCWRYLDFCFLGIRAPDFLASFNAMATACLRLFTFFLPADFKVPCLYSCITFSVFARPFEDVFFAMEPPLARYTLATNCFQMRSTGRVVWFGRSANLPKRLTSTLGGELAFRGAAGPKTL
jgi:hypothetical protein